MVGSLEETVVAELGELLRDCVAGGASVNYIQVPSIQEVQKYWSALLTRPEVSTWIQTGPSGEIAGTVSLVRAEHANGLHRAEVVKLLVRRNARGKGVARRLMATMEAVAAAEGRTLLTLDTESGSPAEALYERWGWTRVGVIPGFALDVNGRPAGSTIFYKAL